MKNVWFVWPKTSNKRYKTGKHHNTRLFVDGGAETGGITQPRNWLFELVYTSPPSSLGMIIIINFCCWCVRLDSRAETSLHFAFRRFLSYQMLARIITITLAQHAHHQDRRNNCIGSQACFPHLAWKWKCGPTQKIQKLQGLDLWLLVLLVLNGPIQPNIIRKLMTSTIQ